jgi:hypothetical protein
MMDAEEKLRLRKGSDTVLRVLQQAKGEWVKNMYARTGVMVHSRVSDLRKAGHKIECKRFGQGDFRYRLVA